MCVCGGGGGGGGGRMKGVRGEGEEIKGGGYRGAVGRGWGSARHNTQYFLHTQLTSVYSCIPLHTNVYICSHRVFEAFTAELSSACLSSPRPSKRSRPHPNLKVTTKKCPNVQNAESQFILVSHGYSMQGKRGDYMHER